MDNRNEVREFLTSRRNRLTPDQAGLTSMGKRRVTGLRRTEVATLAGVSVEYYAKLERGSLRGVSANVLDALARALQLNDAERTHLFNLAQAADGSAVLTTPRRRAPKTWKPRPTLQWMLGTITDGPAIIGNGRMDLLAANQLGRAFYSDVLDDAHGKPNFARFTFLDDAARRFYPDWERFADTAVAILRTEAGRNPHDKELHDLVGELSTRSPEFRARWSAHDVRNHGTGTKQFHHPVVGALDLAYEGFELVAEPGLTMTVYSAEPGSASEQSLRLLASWAASRDTQPADTMPATRESSRS